MKTKHQILMESIDYKPRKVMRIDDINAMAEADIRKNEQIEKLAEKVYLEHENNDLLYGESLELRLAYKAGIVDGYNKAKEMERERIINAVTFGQNNHTVNISDDLQIAEQYYNKTFKSE